MSTPVWANETGVVEGELRLLELLLVEPPPEPLLAASFSCFGAGASTVTVRVGPGASTVWVGPGTSTVWVGPGTSTVWVGPGTWTVTVSFSPASATPVIPKVPNVTASASTDPVTRIRLRIVVPPLLLLVG